MALDFDVNDVAKSSGNLFSGVVVPAAGLSMTITAAGLPDPTQNPLAKHLGYTQEGSVLTTQRELEEDFADEFLAPIRSNIKTVGMSLTGELLQVDDIDLNALLTKGVGTKVVGAGYERITFGRGALTYTGIALIFPLEADPTKFGVFHLYSAVNQAGFERAVSGKTLARMKFDFKAYEITTRAAADTLGQFNKQVAV